MMFRIPMIPARFTRPFLLFCIFSLILVGCESRATIVNHMNERDANEIVVILNSNGIGAEKKKEVTSGGGAGSSEIFWDITVPANQITDAIALLNSSGLPRKHGRTLLDLFGESGLVPSEIQDKVKFQEGLSEGLANTIRMMDGIVDAKVQITLPTGDEEEAAKVPFTAAVLVKHRGILDNPNSLAITKIKRLVSSSLPGLEIDNVTVIADRALSADISLQELQMAEDLEYVTVWGLVIARVSVFHFQMLLYSFFILLFLLFCSFLWLVWKCSPFLLEKEGRAQLFTLKPFDLSPPPSPPTEEEGEEKAGEA